MTDFLVRIGLLYLFLLIPAEIFCQNLVTNCDFDYYISCPNNHGQFDKARNWYIPTQGTSDLCHSCSSEIAGVPVNMWGNQEPYSGLGYGHIISYYSFTSPQYREYMQTELACPLKAGEEYDVSFFVSCSDNSGYGVDGMGLHFSQDSLLQGNSIFISLGGLPEISNPPGIPITDKSGWKEISGTYFAQGGERFITIGNFLSDEEVTIYDFPGSLSNYASYYVGHISVEPRIAWLELGNDTVICSGGSIIANAEIACMATYLWNDGDTNAMKVLSFPGNYQVSVTVGCGSISDEIALGWFEVPDIPIPQDTFLCQGGSVFLDGAGDFNSYLWQDGSQNSSFTANGPGIYWLEVTDGHDCTHRDSTRISLLPGPEVYFGEDQYLCIGDSLLLVAGNTGIYTNYTWQDMSTSDSYLAKETADYWVLVSNPCGSDSDTIHVSFESCETLIWLPNAFSPNNDGYNDEFLARGVNVAKFRMYIYNRWGELVFETDDIQKGWDGRISGKLCPSDVYVWLVNYQGTEVSGSTRIQKGNVLLLR